MTQKFIPELLFEAGMTDLVSVIPPNAELTPSSQIAQSQLGKVPGRRNANGTWGGYDWRSHQPTVDSVRKWCVDGANIGTRADLFPGVDIDTLDEDMAKAIEAFACAKLGPAPLRIGRAPKRLLMYRALEPFGRMRLFIDKGDGQTHLVEVLGSGQQYVLHGTHPTTLKPYTWDIDLPAAIPHLRVITREQVDAFLNELADVLSVFGTVTREGDGKASTRMHVEQTGLLAPSLDVLRDAVSKIPNSNELFPSRTDYLRFGYAIKAASGDSDEAYPIFAEWAEKWTGNERNGGNEPEVVRADWRRMKPPFDVGWNYIAEIARGFGFSDAELEFDVVADAPAAESRTIQLPYLSDQWLAQKCIDAMRGLIRYSPQKGCWLVWENSRWRIDAELLAEDMIKRQLQIIADDVARHGATAKELKEAEKEARSICAGWKLAVVMQLVKSARSIAVSMDALDHDSWALNTPMGIVDLKSGQMLPSDPDALCTKQTAVPPDFGGACPEWKRFLAEATGGDREVEAYLQRLCGYALTGSTEEQQMTFIWGPGGNGKTIFLNVLSGVLGDYHRTATMDTFTASHNDKHSTDVAMLVGSRLVTASETTAGKRWDDARVKSLTGGEAVTARFMRQDNFTFMPQFKLVFIGNHKPEVRDIDAAMQRRIQLVPFTVTPAKVDRALGDKLREEWPAILAWMIDGCLAWQQQGLKPPATVRAATEEYFEQEDAVGRWLKECCTEDGEAHTLSQDLFQSWTEWANSCGEYRGTQRRLSGALIARGFARWRHPETRRNGFTGLRITQRQDLAGLV